MADAEKRLGEEKYPFTHKEIAEVLIKKKGIHEGLWGIYLEFAIVGANIAGPGEGEANPAAIVPVLKIGLQKFDKETPLSVDAAKVNPAPKVKKNTSAK